jgi:fibronectin-binding autotransporter adhesin
MKHSNQPVALFAAAALTLSLCISSTFATDRTWSGGGTDNNWSTANNWGGTAPVNNDNAIFTGAARQNNTNDITSLTFGWLRFVNDGFNLTGNLLTLNPSVAGMFTNMAGTNTISLDLNIAAQNKYWSIASGSELRIAGAVANTQLANPLCTMVDNGTLRVTSHNFRVNRFLTQLSGTFIIDGGFVEISDGYRLQPPAGSTAVFQITNSGTLRILSGGNLRLCQNNTGGSSRVDMSSGLLEVATTSGPGAGDILVGEAASTTTVFNQTGGLVAFTGNGNNRVAFANSSSTATGTYNLNGGVLWTKQIVQVTAGAPATFNFNGGTLKPTASSTTFFQGVQTANVQNGGAFIDTTNCDITIGQVLAGTGGLTKLGTGSLTLTGHNTYTGATVVTNGTLITSSSSFAGGGAITVAGNANLSITSSGTPLSASTLNMGSSVTNSLTLTLGASPAPGGSPVISVNSLNGTGTALINIVGSEFVPGSYPLIGFTTGSGLSAIKLGSLPLGLSATLVQSANALSLNVALVPKNLAWSGALDGNWNTTTFNWFDLNNANNLTNYTQSGGTGDAVTFDDSVSGGVTTINIAGTVTPSQLTANNNVTYTFTGAGKISGATALVKTNAGFGTLSIGTANDYTGGTTINAGNVYVGNNQALGQGPVTLNLGTLASDGMTARTLSNPMTQNANTGITFGDTVNSGTLTLAGGLNLGGGISRTLNLNSDVVVTGSLTNGGIATKTGPGTLTIKGNSVQTGLVSQQQGDVIVDGARFDSLDGWRIQNTAASSTVRLIVTNGGTFTMNANTANLRVGLAGGDNSADNILDISGTVDLTPALGLAGNNAVTLGLSGANDILNLRSDGLLLCRAISGNSPANTEAHFYGGTLTSLANESAFISGLTNAFMENGGLTVDTTNFNVTIAQALLASGTGGLTKQGSGTLTLSGTNTYTGPTAVNGGKLVLGPAHLAPAGILVASNATLAFLSISPGVTVIVSSVTNAGGSALEAQFSGLTNNPSAPAGYVTNLVLNGTVGVNLVGANIKIGQFPLLGYNSISGAGRLVVGQLPQGVVGTLVTNTAAQTIDLVVSSVTPIIWTGSASGNWDTSTTNWTLSGLPTLYGQGDNVRFDDSASNSIVTMTLALSPGGVTVSNSSATYQFNSAGAGALGGSMSLTKDGANSMTLNSANSFLGTVTIKAGTLIVGNNTALGAINGATTILPGGTLNVNAASLGLEPIVVGGNGAGGLGALINTNAQQNDALRDVMLTTNTTIRADTMFGIRTIADTDPGFRGSGYKLTKVGLGELNINGGEANTSGLTIWDSDLGDVDVLEGTLSFERRMTMGRQANTITVAPGATLRVFTLNPSVPVQVKPVHLNNGSFVGNGNVSTDGSTFGGPITVASGSNFVAAFTGTTLRLLGPIDGAGDLYDNSSTDGTVALGGTNTYTGATVVQVGTLTLESTASLAATPLIQVYAGATFDVSAFAPWTLGANQTLGGYGTVNGSVLANGTVSPGASIGTLTFNNDLTLAGTTIIELNKDSGLTNDMVTVNGALTYGGTLKVVLTGSAPLAVSDTFKLFTFLSPPTGSFALNLPAAYTWDTTQLPVDGTITVIAVNPRPHPSFNSVTLLGGSMVLSGTNAIGNYVLVTSTNLAQPVTSWIPVLTNNLSGAFSFTNAMDSAQKFYLLR